MQHHLFLLPGSVKPCNRLGILFIAEREPIPDHSMTTVLEVEAMTSRFRMQQEDRDLPFIPILDHLQGVLGGRQNDGGILLQTLREKISLMLEVVHQDDWTAGLLNDLFCCLDLLQMEDPDLLVLVEVHRPVGDLPALHHRRNDVLRRKLYSSFDKTFIKES